VGVLPRRDGVRPPRLEGLHEAGEGRAIVEFDIRARGRASGIEAVQPAVALATVRDGKLSSLEFFTTLELAQAAVRPQPG
jgi:ketosteroid isomerase-like protein